MPALRPLRSTRLFNPLSPYPFLLHCYPFLLRGTVENLALGSAQPRDVPAVGCIYMAEGEVCPGEVFIAFGGAQGHADRLATCGGLAIRLPARRVAMWGSQSWLQPAFSRLFAGENSIPAQPMRPCPLQSPVTYAA